MMGKRGEKVTGPFKNANFWYQFVRFLGCKQMRHEKKNLLLSMKYWLVNRDPYFMVYEIIPIQLGSLSSPIPNQPGFFSQNPSTGLR